MNCKFTLLAVAAALVAGSLSAQDAPKNPGEDAPKNPAASDAPNNPAVPEAPKDLFGEAPVAKPVPVAPPTPKDFVGKTLPKATYKFLDKGPSTKGRPALVEFWATWSVPCKQGIPRLNELQKKYQGLVVIGITNEDKPTVEKFQKKTPVGYPIALDKDGAYNKVLGISNIPHAFLLDRKGKVVWEGNTGLLTDVEIEKALK